MLTRDFSPKAGGAEHYAMSLVEGLSSRHEVHVFAQTIEHHWPNVHYHRISKPFTRPRFVNQWWYAWQTWVATQSGFDIVHAHENTWHGEVQTVHVLPVWIHYFALKKSSAPWWVSLSRPSVRAAVSHCFKWLGVLLSPRLTSTPGSMSALTTPTATSPACRRRSLSNSLATSPSGLSVFTP